jgi:hypothetical protein
MAGIFYMMYEAKKGADFSVFDANAAMDLKKVEALVTGREDFKDYCMRFDNNKYSTCRKVVPQDLWPTADLSNVTRMFGGRFCDFRKAQDYRWTGAGVVPALSADRGHHPQVRWQGRGPGPPVNILLVTPSGPGLLSMFRDFIAAWVSVRWMGRRKAGLWMRTSRDS